MKEKESHSKNAKYTIDHAIQKYYKNSSENLSGFQNIYISNILKLFTYLPSKDIYIDEVAGKKVNLPQTPHKITICLDLDETLIHSDFSCKFQSHDFVYEGTVGGKHCSLGINFRPGIESFLDYLSRNFEVVLFTSSIKEYADKVLQIIDPRNAFFSYRLYRESCFNVVPGLKSKDLRIISNRNIDDIFLIDNSMINFYCQPENGYLISSFYNDKSDCELKNLQLFLEENKSRLKSAIKERNTLL